MKLVIATRNEGKLREFRELLAGLGLDLIGLMDIGVTQKAEETGATFLENATQKCVFYSKLTHEYVLAEDSGICVDYLGGKPGVFSARYSGDGATDKDNNELLLKQLAGVPAHKRRCRYAAACAVGRGGRVIGTAEGECEGIIAEHPQGSGGFGYDPLFYVPAKQLTMAQLDPMEKNSISHRANAIRNIIPILREQMRQST